MLYTKKYDNDLFYVCSLIEQIGRDVKSPRGSVVKKIGKENLRHLLSRACILHCEVITDTSEDAREFYDIPYDGTMDSVGDCKGTVPSVWDIGKVHARLITDVQDGKDVVDVLYEVYTSWLEDHICNFNDIIYWQSREQLEEWYRNGPPWENKWYYEIDQ